MKERSALEAALEITEAAVDQLGSNDFVKDIPVVGVAFKVCKAALGIRERIYVSKLAAFLSRLDSIPREQQHEMLTSLLTDPDERQKVGERLVMTLEQLTDHDKPAIMAFFFIAYLRRMIDLPFLLRAWDAIAAAYSGDLKILLGFPSEPVFGGGNSHLEYLVRTGLTTPKGTKFINNDAISYVVSGFGKTFIEVYQEGERVLTTE